MTERHEVCPASELPPGERTIVEVSGLSIGVFNVDGEYYGLANVCPHQLAQLCRGQLGAEVTSSAVGEYNYEKEGRIIRCPRHRWAFDVTTGESVFNPHLKTRTFDVEVEEEASGDEGATEDDAREPSERPACQEETYGTSLQGDEPPVDTYSVEVEEGVVVLYV